MADPAKLAAVLQRLEPLLADGVDPGAAEAQRALDASREHADRLRRAEVLSREHVPLESDLEAAHVAGGGARRDVPALAIDRSWLAREPAEPVMVLAGGTGTGKSVAAAYALVEQRAGIWRTAAQLCRTFSASFGDPVDDQELCLTARMLVCDDVGTEDECHRARMRSTLVELLEHRKRRGMRTVITTNLSRKDFVRVYQLDKPEGARLLSRMHRGAGVVAWTEAGGPDLRRSR
jgi:DNA replication protein DnaC